MTVGEAKQSKVKSFSQWDCSSWLRQTRNDSEGMPDSDGGSVIASEAWQSRGGG